MKNLLLFVSVLFATSFVGCSDDDNVEPKKDVAVVKVKVTGADITTLAGTSTMSAEVLPVNAADKSVKWSVNDVTIATIDEASGVLTAVSDGDVTVTATSVGTPTVKGTKEVNVSGQDKPLVGTKWFMFSENGTEVGPCAKKGYTEFSSTELTQYNAYADSNGGCVVSSGATYTYIDNGDGTGTVEGMPVEFTISGNTATVKMGGTTTVYKAK